MECCWYGSTATTGMVCTDILYSHHEHASAREFCTCTVWVSFSAQSFDTLHSARQDYGSRSQLCWGPRCLVYSEATVTVTSNSAKELCFLVINKNIPLFVIENVELRGSGA
jgi:hypothetical protein